MWDSFWPDLLVALIGGAVTVFVAFVTYLARSGLQERRLLQSLIDELHRRRALSVVNPEPIPDAEDRPDFLRANASVLSMKEEVRMARNGVRKIASLQDPLSAMTRACNQYLELSALHPSDYALLLAELQGHLAKSVLDLATARPGVRALTPGAGAF